MRSNKYLDKAKENVKNKTSCHWEMAPLGVKAFVMCQRYLSGQAQGIFRRYGETNL